MNLLLCSILMIGLQAPAQPPAKAVEPPAAQEAFWLDLHTPVQGEAKPPTSLEQAIAQALSNHPEMQLAQAELRVAEAKLAQARIVVSQKVTEDFHRLESQRADVALATATWERTDQLYKKNSISLQEVKAAEHQLANAKARLAATESSWKLMMGRQSVVGATAESLGLELSRFMAVQPGQKTPRALSQFYRIETQPPIVVFSDGTVRVTEDVGTANIIDQLKTHLDTKVKLEKQTNLDLDQAFQKVTDGAGVKVRVKLPITENKVVYRDITHLDLEASEFPLHTWLQLIVDEMNSFQAMSAPQRKESPKRFDLYVREYGLLLTSRDLAPPDSITVQELWKQARLEKAAKEVEKAAKEAKKSQESGTPKK